jgi:hypothetical protein
MEEDSTHNEECFASLSFRAELFLATVLKEAKLGRGTVEWSTEGQKGILIEAPASTKVYQK